ncbi:hypothetical protein BKA65DRAFT_61435 [Rhexocercosporidium sp. MPI-PUGE-AT-0058]|nr:hypothetical protein BKA65DRAFT_61435 [Rhexocercosporidium sp. MPI-PUGE-AT-0058]
MDLVDSSSMQFPFFLLISSCYKYFLDICITCLYSSRIRTKIRTRTRMMNAQISGIVPLALPSSFFLPIGTIPHELPHQ